MRAPHAFPFRQASVLPWASFPRPPRDAAVALRLDLPSAGRSTDLHVVLSLMFTVQQARPAGRTTKKACLKRHARERKAQ